MEVYRSVEARRSPGGLVAGGVPLAEVLDAAAGRLVVEVRNVPGEPDFDAPVEECARLLVALLDGRDHDVTVASFDWYAIEVARDAGVRTAFVTPEGVALDAALAYVTDARHAECQPHWTAVVEDPAAVAKARAAGVSVVARGVPSSEVETLRAAGVDGVVLDDD